MAAFRSFDFFLVIDVERMAAHDVEHAIAGPRASTQNPIKAQGPPNIREAIMSLADKGLYAIPVRMFWDSDKGGKDAIFPGPWKHIVDRDTWRASIATTLSRRPDANGLAILTGPSRLIVIDVDNSSTNKKLPGTELWNRLIATHGEPSTLKAKTGSNGIHLYFRSNSPGLNRKSNFCGLKSGKDIYGIDGRSVGGCAFADPASYTNDEGKLLSYEWLNGPPSYEACSEMPGWLVQIVNNRGDSGSGSDEIRSMGTPEVPAVCAPADQVDPTNGSHENQQSTVVSDGPSNDTSLLRTELSDMLREKAGDSSSTYASTLPHGLYGTYYCYRTRGPRTCYLGHHHRGSNNFNLLKRGRIVYYRCHGQDCSNKPPKSSVC